MSEEIKEAIMQFKTAINFKTATVMPMEYSIDIENAKVLLKYIEQLQQENHMLKQAVDNTYETSQDIMYEMQQKNLKTI